MIPSLADRGTFPPIARPYPAIAIERAHATIRSMYPGRQRAHGENTSRCAEAFNTPLWQQAIWPQLSPREQAEAASRGADLIRAARARTDAILVKGAE